MSGLDFSSRILERETKSTLVLKGNRIHWVNDFAADGPMTKAQDGGRHLAVSCNTYNFVTIITIWRYQRLSSPKYSMAKMEHKTSQEYSWITSLNCQHLDTNAFSYFLLLCQSACAAENMPTACGHTHNNQACVSFSSVEVKKLSHACSSLFSGAQEFHTKKMVLFPFAQVWTLTKVTSSGVVPSSSFFDPNMAIMRSTWAEHSTFFLYISKKKQ